ncbi:hypothetical protein MMC13_005480 [Lambiella insularis]|nr:hypothetical protein [Lambiella insularis]
MSSTLRQEEEFPEPRTFRDVETLVQSLYQPGSPVQIAHIQQSLQIIQRSPEGWAFADALLQSQDANVRFFGALTFTIKINTDCFYMQSAVLGDNSDGIPPSSDILQTLDVRTSITVLWLATTLTEEAGKMGSDTLQTQECHEKVALNLDDMILVLKYILGKSTTRNVALTNEGIKCFQSWVLYAQRAWFKQEQYLLSFKSLNTYVIEHFKFSETVAASREFLVDVMANFPSFLTAQDYEHLARTLYSPATRVFVENLRNGEFDDDTLAYARLLLAFGDAKLQDIARNPEVSYLSSVLGLLEALLMCKGYAIAEDEICSQAIEFWNSFAEYLMDEQHGISMAEAHRPAWITAAIQTIMRVVQACWNKVQLPPSGNDSASWDRETWTEFKAFRKDVEDFIQTSHIILGLRLFERFAQLVLESLIVADWYQIEATLFCLNALADSVSGDDIEDQALSEIFSSGIFAKMTGNTASVPIECQQTAVDMISWYSPFFERHTDYLPQTLNFLFACLKEEDLARHASKAIQSLCDSCRGRLTAELSTFMYQYEVVLTWNTVDAKVKERILGGIAAIVQALTPEEAKLAPLEQLLVFVQHDVDVCLQHLDVGHYDEAVSHGLGALGYLYCIGKAMQAPEDGTIDLETTQTTKWLSSVWEEEPGRMLQSKIVRLYESIFFALQSDGNIVEATCHVLRTGYTEYLPGPFVLSPLKTAELVVRTSLTTARPGIILDTAKSMLTRNMTTYPEDLKPAALYCFRHALQLTTAIDSRLNSN